MKKSIFCFGWLLVCVGTDAQEVLSLDQISKITLQTHPTIRMLEAAGRSSDEAASGAYSWSAPEVGAGFYQTPYNPERWSMKNGNPGMGMVMLSAQQMFPNRKKQDAEYNYMKTRSSIDMEQKEVVLNELMYEIRKNYYSWLILQKKISVLEEDDQLLEFMLKSAEIRYRNGLGKLNAYYKVQAARAAIENMKILYENEIIQKRIMINTAMNRDPETIFSIDTNFQWIDFREALLDSSLLMDRRSDVKVLGMNIEVNNLEREAEIAQLKPEFGIKYDHMMGWAGQPWMFSVMGMARLPLAKWSSKANRARAESLYWENEALRNRQQVIYNEISGQARTSWIELDTRRKQLNQYETKLLPALKMNFQTMQLAYEQNTGDLFELLDAWETWNRTRLESLDFLQMGLLAQARLMQVFEMN